MVVIGHLNLSQTVAMVVWTLVSAKRMVLYGWLSSIYHQIGFGGTSLQYPRKQWRRGGIFAPAYHIPGRKVGDTLCQFIVSREERWGILCASLQHPGKKGGRYFVPAYSIPGRKVGGTLCQLTVSQEERWGILCASLQYLGKKSGGYFVPAYSILSIPIY